MFATAGLKLYPALAMSTFLDMTAMPPRVFFKDLPVSL
jgi:hypothetical protein